MYDTQIPMTAQNPSRFVMPASEETSALTGTGLVLAGATTVAVRTAPVCVVRERHVAADAIAMPFPGPTAWSPPPS